jgi:GTP cyclohydrolase I
METIQPRCPQHDDPTPAGRGEQKVDIQRVSDLVRQLLVELGEDPDREGLLKTPQRVARAMEFLTSGNRADVETIINGAVFEAEANNMILTRDIEV